MEQSLWALLSILIDAKPIAEESAREKEELSRCLMEKRCTSRESGVPGLIYVDRLEGTESKEDPNKATRNDPCLKEKTCSIFWIDKDVALIPAPDLQKCICENTCHIHHVTGKVDFLSTTEIDNRFQKLNCSEVLQGKLLKSK